MLAELGYGSYAGIYLESGDCTHPDVDPADGTSDERYYVLGLEHLPIHEKQAAVYLQKLFYELGDLELRVAASRNPQALAINDATLTSLSEVDQNYRGSEKMGDRHDEKGIEPDSQRHMLVNAVSTLHPLAKTFSTMTKKGELLLDPELLRWVKSPQFEREIRGLRHPEFHAWSLNITCVRNALLASRQFGCGG